MPTLYKVEVYTSSIRFDKKKKEMIHLPRRFKSYNLNTHERRAYNHRVLCDGSNACICGIARRKMEQNDEKSSRGNFFNFLFF